MALDRAWMPSWRRSWRWPALTVVVAVACIIKVQWFGGFGVFVMSPTQWDACAHPQGIPVDVRWLALSRSGVRFSVYGLGDHPTLWKEAGRMGRARTEPWFWEGSTLVMTDMDGHMLWRKTMTAPACPGQ